MRQVTTYKGQGLVDIAIQEYGDITGVELLIEDNSIGLCDYIPEGTVLNIRETVIKPLVVEALQSRSAKPNLAVDGLHGIGYWAVGINFQIQ